ncbi:MAG: hypothetical protein ACWGNO_00155 [Desulfobacterales bacterium]
MKATNKQIFKYLNSNWCVWVNIIILSTACIHENFILGIGITTALTLAEMTRQVYKNIANDSKTALYILNEEIEKFQKFRYKHAEMSSETDKTMQ